MYLGKPKQLKGVLNKFLIVEFLIDLKVTHLKCPKCNREFDVEVEGHPLVSRAGTRTMNISGVFVVYDDHRLGIHPTWFFGYRIHCPYCGKTSKYDISLE